MEHALTISLEEFDFVYTDVDWYGHDEEDDEDDEDDED